MTEQTEWICYILVGILVPALAFLIARSGFKKKFIIPGITTLACLVILIVQAEDLVGPRDILAILFMASLHFALDWYFSAREKRPLELALQFLFVFTIWFLASRLLWFTHLKYWLTHEFSTMLVTVGALLLSHFALRANGMRELNPKMEKALFAISAGIFVLFATRPTLAFIDGASLAGPVDLVKQGGWLLWDVPSQYGFLNILLISLVPADSSWYALYLTNSFFLFVTSVLLFYFCYRTGKGFLHWLFSTLLVIVAVFMAPGWLRDLVGVNSLPSIGGFRFFWCYVLLLIFVTYISEPKKCFRLGSIAWSLAALWSFESLIFATIIWFPAALDLASGSLKDRMHVIIRTMGVFIALVAMICLYYFVRLGHLPDVRGYYEFAVAYKGGIGALPVNLAGGVWFLIFVYALLAAALVISTSIKNRPIILAAGAVVWSTASYYVWRSHENQIANLGPLFLSALFCGIYVTQHEVLIRTTKFVLIAVFTFLAAGTFGNEMHLQKYLNSLFASRVPATIYAGFPVTDPALTQLLEGVQLSPDQPLVIFSVGPIFPNKYKTWLPYSPDILMSLLPIPRQYTYIDRFLERTGAPAGGLVQSLEVAASNENYIRPIGMLMINPKFIIKKLQESYMPIKSLQNNKWQIILFERKSN